IDWARFEENQRMLLENAHMKRRAARKSGRGGRALLTGLVRCGRCGRVMRGFYGMRSGPAHRQPLRGGDGDVGSRLCVGVRGARWNAALERVAALEARVARLDAGLGARPRVDREALLRLARDLPRVWNAAGTDARPRQRIVRLLIEEVVVDLDGEAHEAVLLIH